MSSPTISLATLFHSGFNPGFATPAPQPQKVDATGTGAFDYNQVANAMAGSTGHTDANLASFSNTMDPGSSADMVKLQAMTQQWTMAVNLQSVVLKNVGDLLHSMVLKVG